MAKKRNTRYKLTWVKQKRYWRKIYHGKTYVFRPADGEGQADSYQRCLSEWLAKKAEIDGAHDALLRQQNAEYMRPVRTALADKIQGLIDAFGDSDDLRFYVRRLLDLEDKAAEIAASTEDLSDSVDGIPINHAEIAADGIQWELDRLGTTTLDDELKLQQIAEQVRKQLGGKKPKNPPGRPPWEAPTNEKEMLQVAISEFLADIRDNKSASRLRNCTKSLELFTEYLPSTIETTVEALTSDLLSGFAREIKRRYPNSQTAFQRAQPVQQFTTWCYRRELIDNKPRLFEEGSLVSKGKPKQRGTFQGIDDLKPWLTCEHQLIKTVCLVIANTGLMQADIAGFTKNSFFDNYIETSRVKTGIRRRWILWPETKAALEITGVPVLSNRGLRLVDDQLDRFRSTLKSYQQGSKLPPLKPRRIRSASASLLNTDDRYARFSQYWLAHTPTSVADQHYIEPSQDQFDAAVRWLRDQWLS